MSDLCNDVSEYIGLTLEQTKKLARLAPTTYRRYTIPKKPHGRRVIFHPAKQTKCMQYAVLDLLLARLPVHSAAMAYRKYLRSPLLKNAERHARFKYSVHVDLKDFFLSIRPADLFELDYVKKVGLTDDDKAFLENLLFVRVSDSAVGLAVGAPSSPIISNAVMFRIDKKLDSYANDMLGVYTRYADDIVFSTDNKGDCAKFVSELRKMLKRTKSPHLLINPVKTRFMSRRTRRQITGLIVCPDARVSIGRKNKRYIRKLVWDLKNANLGIDGQAYLQGYLAYVLDVDPKFYSQLVMKYGAELIWDALNGNRTVKH